MIFVYLYLLLINIFAMTAMGIDKNRAIKKQWRIPEKRLFLYVILGGGVGGCCGMIMFRHKTKHWYFKLFFPLITILEYTAIIYALGKYVWLIF